MPSAFRRHLRQVDRKHRGAAGAVEKTLDDIAAQGVPPQALRIPGFAGASVFKLRIPVGGAGKQAGRLIFHYDGQRLVPLFVYTKADVKDIAPSEIRDALRAAGLGN